MIQGYVDDYVGYDFLEEHGDPYDDNGHGTHVAGIIGGVGNNTEVSSSSSFVLAKKPRLSTTLLIISSSITLLAVIP